LNLPYQRCQAPISRLSGSLAPASPHRRRLRRSAAHRPVPVETWFGGQQDRALPQRCERFPHRL